MSLCSDWADDSRLLCIAAAWRLMAALPAKPKTPAQTVPKKTTAQVATGPVRRLRCCTLDKMPSLPKLMRSERHLTHARLTPR